MGAPGRGARPRGLRLPRELLSPAFRCLLLSLLCYPGSGTLRPCPCWRGWEGGVGAWPTAGRPQVHRRAGAPSKGRPADSLPPPAVLGPPRLAGTPESPRRPRSAALSARERPPRGAQTRGNPATRGRVSPVGRPPSPHLPAAAASPNPRGFGRRAGGGRASRPPAAAARGSAQVKTQSLLCLSGVSSRAEQAPSPLFAV